MAENKYLSLNGLMYYTSHMKQIITTKIEDLIDGAPITLDTLGKIATTMEELHDVVEALDNAIGSKADVNHAHDFSELTDDIGLVRSSVPIGSILMWSGSADNVPRGFRLCDGANGTPDLRGRFVIGSGGDYEVGDVGGESEHILTVDEMPSHSHTTGILNDKSGNYVEGFTSAIVLFDQTSGIQTDVTGGSQPHNTLPPYYALCYIMRVEKAENTECIPVVTHTHTASEIVDMPTTDEIVSEVLQALPTWEGGEY